MFRHIHRIARQVVVAAAVAVFCLASSSTYSIVNQVFASHEEECYHDIACNAGTSCDTSGQCVVIHPTGCGKQSENGEYDFSDHDVHCGLNYDYDGMGCTILNGNCGVGACFPCASCPRE